MQTQSPPDRPALWNPNAAIAWSLLFTPVFGAWLHALNWRALGETERERESMAWVAAGVVLLALTLLFDTTHWGTVVDVLDHLIALVFLAAWYFMSARPQARLVRESCAGFERKGWREPIGLALAGFAGYVGVLITIEAVIGLRNL